MKATIVSVVLFMMVPSIWLRSQTPPAGNQQQTENAAVKYLRADAALRQAYALAPDAAAKLEKSLALPLDGEDEKLVAAAEDALVEFHHGAAIKRCDWIMSDEDGALAGAKAGSLAVALKSDAAFLEKHLGRYAQNADNGFTALNQAFFLDGGFVHLSAGTVVEEPIQLVYVSTAKQPGATIHPRNLIIAGANSKVTILESYVALGGANYFTNAVTELFAGDNARLEFVKFQDEPADAFHMAAFYAELGRASNVTVHSFALGASLVFFETPANTLFLQNFSVQTLSYVYMLTAVVTAFLGYIYAKLEARLTPAYLLSAILGFLLTSTCIFYLALLRSNAKWLAMGLMPANR